MYSKIFSSLVALLLGVAMGFWWDSGHEVPANASTIELAEQNNRLLASIDERLGQASFRHTFSQGGECADLSALLPPLKRTIKESVQSLAGEDGARAMPISETGESNPPTEEQVAMYQSVKQGLYTYASSGEPLLEAMGNDRDFQQLSASQKKRLAREVAQRFNQGEITMSQLRGR